MILDECNSFQELLRIDFKNVFGEMFDQEFNFIWIQGSSRLNLKLMTSKSIRLRLDIQNRFGEIFVQEFNLIWTQRYLRLYFENV